MPATRSSKRRKIGQAGRVVVDPLSLNEDSSHDLHPQPFKYTSLDPENDEIRLLRISAPRKFDGITCGVECEIFHAPLSADLEYEALSYVWGDRTQRQSITIDGQPFNVTTNLYSALQELRALKRGKPVWIDAICINQEDADERSKQVRKMGRIFSCAFQVVAWLGVADAESERAISLIHVLHGSIDDSDQTRNTIRDPQYLEHFFGLYKLFYRDYWWRVWVIQEVALATNSITILCGATLILWPDLVRVQETLAENHMKDIDLISFGREELSFLRTTIESRGPRALLLPSTTTDTPDLSQILLKHRFKESTDPKDKVYSLVGLSNARDDPLFIIDYSRSVREVYIDLVKYVALTSKKLDIICAMPRGVNSHNLPSWTPDWSFGGLGSSLLNESFEHQYTAAGHSQVEANVSKDGTLLVKGICIDTMSLVGRLSGMEDLEDEINAFRALFDWYKLFVPSNEDKTTAQASFSRTLLRDNTRSVDNEGWDKQKLPRKALGAFVRAANLICPEIKMDQDLISLSLQGLPEVPAATLGKETREMTFGRRFAVTNSKLPCLAPETIMKGDLVCILFGCRIPVILRPERNHYLFLGEAYIDGYMYGLAMEEFEAGKLQDRHFKIH